MKIHGMKNKICLRYFHIQKNYQDLDRLNYLKEWVSILVVQRFRDVWFTFSFNTCDFHLRDSGTTILCIFIPLWIICVKSFCVARIMDLFKIRQCRTTLQNLTKNFLFKVSWVQFQKCLKQMHIWKQALLFGEWMCNS